MAEVVHNRDAAISKSMEASVVRTTAIFACLLWVAVPRRCRKQTFSPSFLPVHTDSSLSPVTAATKAEELTAKLAVAVDQGG